MTIRAISFDAFGTLIQYGTQRHNPYQRLLDGRQNDHDERLAFLTRNIPATNFAVELRLEYLLPEFERELLEELAGLQLFAEVPDEVLGRARRPGLKLAACSNLALPYGAAVRQLLPELDAYILSFELGTAKPQPAIYAATFQALGCRPAEVVFVGDSQRCDFERPLAFGMQPRRLERKIGQTLLNACTGIL